MKTTRYFTEQVLRKRPYLELSWCADAIERPLRREVQDNGRIRLWVEVVLPGEEEPRVLRVVTLDDGETLLNAFIDCVFKGIGPVKLHYYPETDSLYIELRSAPSIEMREIAAGLNADFAEDGVVVGLDIDFASRLELASIDVGALPLKVA